jgi:hypothetical protein
VLVRDARIAELYRIDGQGRLEEDEAMRCFACGFASRLPSTAVFAWRRVRPDVEPPVLELCEICDAAAGVAQSAQPNVCSHEGMP